MWIHLPSSLCAPESRASTSDSSSLWKRCAQSVTWSTKQRSATSWSRAWKTAPLKMRLFGRMLKPSAANRGAAAWISSLPVIPASRSVVPENSAAKKIRVISGLMSHGSSAKFSRPSSSSKTSRTICASDFTRSQKSYEAWVTNLRRESLQRRKSARLTSENGSSSWPTAQASNADFDGIRRPVIVMPSGKVQHTGAKSGIRGGGSLVDTVQNWPTPRSEDSESCGNHPGTTDSLTGATRNWKTLHGMGNTDRFGKTAGGGGEFAKQAMAWPTPKADDGPHNGRTTKGGNQTHLPWIAVCFRPDLPTSTDGTKSSDAIRRLNPVFVESLMGFPRGWSDCAPLATASYRLWLHTHSARLRELPGRDAKPSRKAA